MRRKAESMFSTNTPAGGEHKTFFSLTTINCHHHVVKVMSECDPPAKFFYLPVSIRVYHGGYLAKNERCPTVRTVLLRLCLWCATPLSLGNILRSTIGIGYHSLGPSVYFHGNGIKDQVFKGSKSLPMMQPCRSHRPSWCYFL